MKKEGYIRGTLYLHGGHKLHVAEYVVISQGMPIAIKYRYQLQTPDSKSTARWDNAPLLFGNPFPRLKRKVSKSWSVESFPNLR